MLTTVEAIYDNGEITWTKTPPPGKAKVLVTFTEEIPEEPRKPRQFGTMKGQIRMSEDFNEPLDDLKDYM
mgnify:CR=1 FL=1